MTAAAVSSWPHWSAQLMNHVQLHLTEHEPADHLPEHAQPSQWTIVLHGEHLGFKSLLVHLN